MRCLASKCSIKIAPNRRRTAVLGIVYLRVDTNAFSVALTSLPAAIEARSRFANERIIDSLEEEVALKEASEPARTG